MAIPRILRELLTVPTAPFAENAVLEFVRNTCAGFAHVKLAADRYGNLLAHYRHKPPRRTPLVFTAHTDHPGFVALKMLGPKMLRASFRGWVEPEYFIGTRVRFWNDEKWIGGRIRKILKTAKIYRMIGRSARPEEVAVEVASEVAAGAPGMWDLPDPYEKAGCVHARGCDDIAGCATMLALLQRLSRRKAAAEVYCLFTRAEEVGFVGAIGAAKAGTIPRKLPIVAIETSKALPSARIGDGPILRVGDKSSVFTPDVTAFCYRVAQDVAAKRKSFKYQRKLMDGGTCESTAYCAYGYAATGMCVALGNYHNMNMERKKIESEYISLDDWKGMVDWFEALVLAEPGYGAEDRSMRKGLDKRFAQWRGFL
ncbi:MAG: M20/M25/M40 family metallo-hydrolase [Planctomycetes bacterium]|nr:M20/M25/M40 family metallo-hydrolase [Planctomycetota bacterium]